MAELSEQAGGRFERVAWHPAKSDSAAEGWTHEASDLTPWLSENLDLLGQELGLALELEAREHAVGRYSLDLLVKDARDRVVIVENQFGQTDHDHLGKVLTYCAGTKAQVVIWICERLTDEHRAALEWLNENTISAVAFFGVELALVTIGDSKPAPFFRVIVRPNEWSKPPGPTPEWGWENYRKTLAIPESRLAVGKDLVERLETLLVEEGLPWQTVFRKGYVAFKRPGDYNVLLVDMYWRAPPRLAVKIPASPADLGLENPFHPLTWSKGDENEWGWTIPASDEIPDLAPVIDIARRYHPASGPMVVPPATSLIPEPSP